MSRLNTIERYIHKDKGLAPNRDRVLKCMSSILGLQATDNTCIVGTINIDCENCPSDSKSNLVKVLECLDLKPS